MKKQPVYTRLAENNHSDFHLSPQIRQLFHHTIEPYMDIASASHALLHQTIAKNHLFKVAFPLKASRVAQWKRAGPITQRSVDRNHALLNL